MKSTLDEIRQRFDADVEPFSNLYTGQSATVELLQAGETEGAAKAAALRAVPRSALTVLCVCQLVGISQQNAPAQMPYHLFHLVDRHSLLHVQDWAPSRSPIIARIRPNTFNSLDRTC
jgi:hypothetical protein